MQFPKQARDEKWHLSIHPQRVLQPLTRQSRKLISAVILTAAFFANKAEVLAQEYEWVKKETIGTIDSRGAFPRDNGKIVHYDDQGFQEYNLTTQDNTRITSRSNIDYLNPQGYFSTDSRIGSEGDGIIYKLNTDNSVTEKLNTGSLSPIKTILEHNGKIYFRLFDQLCVRDLSDPTGVFKRFSGILAQDFTADGDKLYIGLNRVIKEFDLNTESYTGAEKDLQYTISSMSAIKGTNQYVVVVGGGLGLVMEGLQIKDTIFNGLVDGTSYSNNMETYTRNDGVGGHEIHFSPEGYVDVWVEKQTDPNEAPTDITLSNNTIDEGVTAGSVIGNLSTTDPDAGDNHTYQITGGADASRFTIDGNQLKINHSPDFDTQSHYDIEITTSDQYNAQYTKLFTIQVNQVNTNNAPTDITLSNNAIDEGVSAGSVIGNLSTTDPDAGDNHTYQITGGADASRFTIDGNQLKINHSPDFDTQPHYDIEITTSDQYNAQYTKLFTIQVNQVNTNNAPTDITLSNNAIDEGVSAGSVIGNLSTTDPDAGDNHTYQITGGADASRFTIDGNQLKINHPPDFDTQSHYDIEITTSDQYNGQYTKPFTIHVNEVNTGGGDNETISVFEDVKKYEMVGIIAHLVNIHLEVEGGYEGAVEGTHYKVFANGYVAFLKPGRYFIEGKQADQVVPHKVNVQ